MGRKFGLFLFVGVIAIYFAFAVNVMAASYPTADKPLKLKGGHVLAPGSTADKACHAWADLVKERTKGAIVIEVFPAEQLGVEKNLTEQVNLGVIDWAFIGPGSLARFTPEFGIFENAYVYQSAKHLENMIASVEFTKYLSGILEKKSDLKFMGFQWSGPRNVLGHKPILSPSDGEGLRLRIPDVPSYRVAAYAVGATATPLPFGEVYMALKQGVIDACEGSSENIYKMKFHEVAKTITLTGHIQSMGSVAMSNRPFKKMSPDQQNIVLDSALEVWLKFYQGYSEVDQSFRKKLEAEGVKFVDLTDAQFNVFRERAVEKLNQDYIPEWGETWDKFNALAE
jgi:C4-dicarboxylate-binding protein DctP